MMHRRVDDRRKLPDRAPDVSGDRLVAQLAVEVGLPVVVQTGWQKGVEETVERGIGHRADQIEHWRAELTDRRDRLRALVQRSAPAGDDRADRDVVKVLGNERGRRRDVEAEERPSSSGA